MTSRGLFRAFFIGALLHAGLLWLSFYGGPLATPATLALLLLALPGALVDMSAEVLHPGRLGTVGLILVGSALTGLTYAGLWALIGRLRQRARSG